MFLSISKKIGDLTFEITLIDDYDDKEGADRGGHWLLCRN